MNLKIGDRVKVIDDGCVYQGWSECAKKFNAKKWNSTNSCHNGDMGIIRALGNHDLSEDYFDFDEDEVVALVEINGIEVIIGCDGLEFISKSNGKLPKANFLLKYDLDEDPIEEYETMKEVEERITWLVENKRSLRRDSIIIYEIKAKHEVTVATKISKKLIK